MVAPTPLSLSTPRALAHECPVSILTLLRSEVHAQNPGQIDMQSATDIGLRREVEHDKAVRRPIRFAVPEAQQRGKDCLGAPAPHDTCSAMPILRSHGVSQTESKDQTWATIVYWQVVQLELLLENFCLDRCTQATV